MVKEAENKATGEVFALKIVQAQDETVMQATLKEFEILQDLEHASIMKAEDFYLNWVTGTVYAVYSTAEGQSLSKII